MRGRCGCFPDTVSGFSARFGEALGLGALLTVVLAEAAVTRRSFGNVLGWARLARLAKLVKTARLATNAWQWPFVIAI